jgi:hypothetical protein
VGVGGGEARTMKRSRLNTYQVELRGGMLARNTSSYAPLPLRRLWCMCLSEERLRFGVWPA